jgi:hypothetical protein
MPLLIRSWSMFERIIWLLSTSLLKVSWSSRLLFLCQREMHLICLILAKIWKTSSFMIEGLHHEQLWIKFSRSLGRTRWKFFIFLYILFEYRNLLKKGELFYEPIINGKNLVVTCINIVDNNESLLAYFTGVD